MKTEEQTKNDTNTDLIDRMFTAGAHFGYSKSRRHPSTAPYIFGLKNRVEIFNLEKTSDLLSGAKEYMKMMGAQKKTILFVGGKNEARSTILKAAEELNMPYVNGRWIGGTLTNFSEIKKRIDRLKELIEQKDKGELEAKYTKKEQLLLDREITDLKTTFGGVISLVGLPDALVIVDTKKEDIAFSEAKVKKLPVVGLLNSDSNMKKVDYPIVANDASQKSIGFVIDELVASYNEGVNEPKPAEESTENK